MSAAQLLKLALVAVSASLLLVACCAFAGEAPEVGVNHPSDEVAVDMITQGGKHIIFPYGDPNLKELDPKLKAAMDEDNRELFGYCITMMDNLLVKTKNGPGFFQYMKAGKDLISIAYRQGERKKKLGAFATVSPDYFKSMHKALIDTLNKGAELEKTLKGTPKSPKELGKAGIEFISNLQEAMLASPVSSYIDYQRATFDGVSFSEEAAQMIGLARHNGYGTMLNFLQMAVDKMFKSGLIK